MHSHNDFVVELTSDGFGDTRRIADVTQSLLEVLNEQDTKKLYPILTKIFENIE